MKILYTNDWHLTDKRPLNRIDTDFFEVQFKKVSQILKIATERGVDSIIHGGDWFDAPRVDFAVLNELIRLFKAYGVGEKIPTIQTVIGNHDIFGYNLESVKKSVLGTLLRTGLVKIVEGDGAVHITTNHTVDIYKSIKAKVIVTHNLVSPNPVPYPFILCDEIAPYAKDKIILCGHKHYNFLYENKAQNCIMVNTGCLVRTSTSEKNHMPYVVIIDTDAMTVEKVPLTVAQRGEYIFDLTLRNKEEKKTFNIDEFVKDLKTTKFSHSDIREIFAEFVKDKKVDPETLEEAFRRIDLVK